MGRLKRKTILDAGCGTAHRLLGFAKAFPECKFLGIDMTTASLTIARELAERHGIANVHFQQAGLLELNLATEFDLIYGEFNRLLDRELLLTVSLGNDSRLIDLAEASEKAIRTFCLRDDDLFKSPSVKERYRQLGNRDKLKVIELTTRPNGFALVSGKKDTHTL